MNATRWLDAATRRRGAGWRGRDPGQAAIEYLLVVALIGVALLGGERSAVSRVVASLGEHYQRFSWSVAQP
jgi:Flp pilus assembly pilin Flp